MKDLTIHIGLHKTGTTFIQNNLTDLLPGVEIIEGWRPISKLTRGKSKGHVILSDEGLSGNLWGGSYLNDFYDNVKTIKKMFNEPKIIIGIRNPNTLIPSIYKQYLHEKGWQNFEYLFNDEDTGLLKHEAFLLVPKIQYLQDNFKDVFIYSQESLKDRQNDFLIALSHFLNLKNYVPNELNEKSGKSRNISVKSKFQVNSLRKMNKLNFYLENVHPNLSLYSKAFLKCKLTPRIICQNYLGVIKSKTFKIDDKQMDFIKKYYRADWEKASKLISY